MASATSALHRTLRRIPILRSLSSRELEDARERMVYRAYQTGDVVWRTHGPLHFSGYIQSGEIELEYRAGGVPVRKTRLRAGDPLPPRALHNQRSRDLVIAWAVTDVRLGILPEQKQARLISHVQERQRGWMNWLWPVMLLLLVIFLARDDLVRISSGLLYLAARQGDAAASDKDQSMSLLKAARDVDKGAAFAYNEEGYRWFQQNNLQDAFSAFNEAVVIDPASAPALNNLGITYLEQGRPSQAAQYLQQAVDQAPDNPVARYNLGISLMELQDPAGAIREFRQAGFIDPKAEAGFVQQAALYQQTGDYARAEENARSALQLNPSLVPANLLLGMALYSQGREKEALASFTETLRLDPGNRVADFYQALILGHQKQYDAALPILRRLFFSSTEPAETLRILTEMDALGRLKAEPADAGP